MGIKNLSKLLARVAPMCRSERTLDHYAGRRFAIDTPIYMYKFAALTSGRPLRCFQDQLRSLRALGIVPTYVFDGAVAPAKQEEIARRREQRAGTRSALAAARSQYESMQRNTGMMTRSQLRQLSTARQTYMKLQRRVASIPTRAHYQQLRDFLRRENVPFVDADGDAEKVCATLLADDHADVVVTDDYDALVYMAVLAEGRGKMAIGINRPVVVEYDVADMLREMEVTREMFVDVCILSGCDFTSKIRGIACNRALQLIKEHNDIETILETLDDKFEVPEDFAYAGARAQFGL